MSTERNASYNILSYLGIVVLTTLFGMGATWIVVALRARHLGKNAAENLLAHIMPNLEFGGAIGFVAGILAAAYIARVNPETKARLEEKCVRRGDRTRIYFGAPFFIITFLGQWIERLPHLVGESAFPYVLLGIFLFIIAVSLFLYDYIPRRMVIPIGILGWLLTAAMFIIYGIHMARSWH